MPFSSVGSDWPVPDAEAPVTERRNGSHTHATSATSTTSAAGMPPGS